MKEREPTRCSSCRGSFGHAVKVNSAGQMIQIHSSSTAVLFKKDIFLIISLKGYNTKIYSIVKI